MTNTTNKPEKTFRIGNASVSIWKRTAKEGNHAYYSAQFQRSYRSEEATQYTDSFDHDDLLNVAELAKRAERWIASQSA
jgi:hypothetical protein